jgi:hypothetical protein
MHLIVYSKSEWLLQTKWTPVMYAADFGRNQEMKLLQHHEARINALHGKVNSKLGFITAVRSNYAKSMCYRRE